MPIDDLKEQLRTINTSIHLLKNYWDNNKKEELFNELSHKSEQENFWQDPHQADVLKKLQHVRQQREQLFSLINSHNDLNELISLFADDEKELTKIAPDVKDLQNKTNEFKIFLLMNGPHDLENCFLSINAGAGGTESQDWANMLLRMYLRFCERNKLAADIIDIQQGEEAGIKSASLHVKGDNAYGLLRSEHGVHRLVRISPFDSNKRRHTSFAGVSVTPELKESETITIDPSELRIDTYRSSGAGGQHVNKTESAIRITHLPTNIVVQCQNERSQGQNKATAMNMLRSKLAQKQQEERESYLSSSIKKEKAEWGSQIRSYVLHPYKMVKDHRTDQESPQPEKVLDGELVDFIESYLVSAEN